MPEAVSGQGGHEGAAGAWGPPTAHGQAGLPAEQGPLRRASSGSRWARAGADPLGGGARGPPAMVAQYSCAGKGLTPAQDPTLAPLPSYAAPGPSWLFLLPGHCGRAWVQARGSGSAGLRGLQMLGNAAPRCPEDMGTLPRRVPLGAQHRAGWQVRESGAPAPAAVGTGELPLGSRVSASPCPS